MGTMAYSLSWAMQDLYHLPQFLVRLRFKKARLFTCVVLGFPLKMLVVLRAYRYADPRRARAGSENCALPSSFIWFNQLYIKDPKR